MKQLTYFNKNCHITNGKCVWCYNMIVVNNAKNNLVSSPYMKDRVICSEKKVNHISQNRHKIEHMFGGGGGGNYSILVKILKKCYNMLLCLLLTYLLLLLRSPPLNSYPIVFPFRLSFLLFFPRCNMKSTFICAASTLIRIQEARFKVASQHSQRVASTH